jgi:hypothetical protein
MIRTLHLLIEISYISYRTYKISRNRFALVLLVFELILFKMTELEKARKII